MDYHDLITKFLAGEISDTGLTYLKSWLEEDKEHLRIFDTENEIWQGTGVHANVMHYKTDAAWASISPRLGLGKDPSANFTLVRSNKFRFLIGAVSVACVVALVALGLWISGKNKLNRISASSTVIATIDGEKANICLADSSRIILNSESSIQYSSNYNNSDRRVKLTGEAYFDIATNPRKPFIVELDKMSIAATGTRFNVFYFPGEDRIEATLEEGSIHISIEGKEPIYLIPGQQAIYYLESDTVLVKEVVTEIYSEWKENKLRFVDAPLEEVLKKLGRKFNVEFEIGNPDLLKFRYTATFIDESIEEVMQLLQDVSPISCRIIKRTSENDKQYIKPKILVSKAGSEPQS